LRLRLLLVLCVLSLSALVGAVAAGSSSAATCGDTCVISSPFDGLRADIATNAPSKLVRLFTAEANLSQALHPPGPCVPGSCVASQLVLIALDLQVRGLPVQGCPGGCGFGCPGGCTLGCPGGCSFNATNAYVLDNDIRGILTNTDVYPLELQILPPGPPTIPAGPPGIPGPQ